jgi:hypothetical protein
LSRQVGNYGSSGDTEMQAIPCDIAGYLHRPCRSE